jgi:hypothetical protein
MSHPPSLDLTTLTRQQRRALMRQEILTLTDPQKAPRRLRREAARRGHLYSAWLKPLPPPKDAPHV